VSLHEAGYMKRAYTKRGLHEERLNGESLHEERLHKMSLYRWYVTIAVDCRQYILLGQLTTVCLCT
jgi:hypothetical protein